MRMILILMKINSLSLKKFSTKHGIKSEGFWHWEMAYFFSPFSFKLLSRNLCTKQHNVFVTNFFAVVVIISLIIWLNSQAGKMK